MLCCNTYAQLQRAVLALPMGRSEPGGRRRGLRDATDCLPTATADRRDAKWPRKEYSRGTHAVFDKQSNKNQTWTVHSSFRSRARKNERICSRTAET